jgi:hypothetical protein
MLGSIEPISFGWHIVRWVEFGGEIVYCEYRILDIYESGDAIVGLDTAKYNTYHIELIGDAFYEDGSVIMVYDEFIREVKIYLSELVPSPPNFDSCIVRAWPGDEE